ncbi:MAG: hypothetical protein J0M15_15535 [Deltaproteobacteria bacterium]|nr:hypothetical protein [Deltaproteobacteria bacterium]
MARPHGFDHFCTYLIGLEKHYVIIGGGAAAILMEDEGLEFRATKDVDLVVLGRSEDLNTRILSYVEEGEYKTKEATEGTPRYYRFREPDKKECPALIEIFARNELKLELAEGQYIIPIKDDSAEKLSAILLDDEYFEIIQKNLVTSSSGIPLINALANICLKARAHRELFDRKNSGDDTVDEKSVQKHLKDIWRLAAVLTGDEEISLTGQPQKDVTSAIAKLGQLPSSQFKQVMEKTPGITMVPIMAALKKVFLKNSESVK